MTAWRFAAGQATGSAHEKLGKPCQDRFACCVEEDGQTLIAAVSDGAGTAEHAHQQHDQLGAEQQRQNVQGLLAQREPEDAA